MKFPRCLWRLIAILSCACADAGAQVNSWNGASGGWEELHWTLGIRPGTGQSIMLTNVGWKAVMIGPGTARNFPLTLTVNSVTVSSPANSFNTLLLNYAGTQNPLRVNALTVASNSSVVLLSSALIVNDPGSSTFSIGGTFNHGAYSSVTATQLDIGYIGPGVYNLTNGFLTTSMEYVGGGFPAVLNQENGLHSASILQINPGAEFYLRGGWFSGGLDVRGTVYQTNGTNSSPSLDLNGGKYILNGGMITGIVTVAGSTSTFTPTGLTQNGGIIKAPIAVNPTGNNGTYILNGGIHSGGITAGIWSGPGSRSGAILQTGGTHLGNVTLGGGVDFHFGNRGSYTMSNGVFIADAMVLNSFGTFSQWNGSNAISGAITITGAEFFPGGNFGPGRYELNGGILSAGSLYLNIGSYSQSGGTNRITGDVIMVQNSYNYFSLSGGLLCDRNTIIQPNNTSGFVQTGGTHIITNLLTLDGNTPWFVAYTLAGGQLTVSNIQINSTAQFKQTGGTVTQSGVLTLANGTVFAGPGAQQFGRLQLSVGYDTNSTFYLPTGACVLRFADSRALSWSNGAALIVENWEGSLSGGGAQRMIFGNSADALTGPQLSRIQFLDPAGLPAGNYPARILSTGEIVPDSSAASAARLSLRQETNGMQLSLQGEPGGTYRIEVSTNLLNWTAWTTQVNASGIMVVNDESWALHPRRFYRAVLLP